MSTMSSLSASDEARAASAQPQSLLFNMDEFASSDSSDDGAPSPKKILPDFTLRKSDDDSVASGDDSNGWEREEDRVRNAFIIQADADDELELANFTSDGPVNEVLEWTTLTDDLEMGNADDEVAALPAEVVETRNIVLQKTNVKTLKSIALRFSMSHHGNKRALFDRIRDSPHATKVSADEFQYRHSTAAGERVPTWIILDGEEVPAVAGIDMNTGSEKGFFGPTNKENATGGKRTNFLTWAPVERPQFGPKKPPKKRKESEDDSSRPPEAVREDGHPSNTCRKLLPPLSKARPKDFFDTQITPRFVEWAVTATNLRAYANGAGSGQYTDYVPFDVAEMYKMFGVLFTNGLSPKPQFEYWFCSEDREPLLGSNLISHALRKRNSATGKTIKAARRWMHFRRYFTVADYHDSPKDKQRVNPLWKVQELLDELNNQAKDMWVPGKFVAIDEQTIGFQGASGMKLRISYKREGDGFQCDAVCDAGYTFSFYFHHGPPPNVGDQYKSLELSPTARRVVWLASRLPNKWTRIYMDNLFNSQKLFTALHTAEALAHGVARANGRGVPPSIIQKEEKNKDRAEKLRGTTMAAKLHNSNACPDLFAVSVYDTKPVHILSTAAECVEWIVKERKVWSESAKSKSMMKYLRLNVIDDYNNRMNATDIADQLRGNYRPDHWMRNRKWWWAFFIWAIGVAGVNAYKIYQVLYDEEEAKKTPGLPQRWTHARFLEELVYDFIFPGRSSNVTESTTTPAATESDDVSTLASLSTPRSFSVYRGVGRSSEGIGGEVYNLNSSTGRREYLESVATVRITKHNLERGSFPHRLDGMRHNWVPLTDISKHCQYCYYHLMNEIEESDRRHFVKERCLVCHVNLCPQCDNIFHGSDLTAYIRV